MTEALNEDGLLVNTPDAIFTYSGIFIRPLAPDPRAIRIVDIAHALSQQCRWTGHTATFYSVAEHCLGVAKLVAADNRDLALPALLHDASEAYLADLARPIKKAAGLGEVYLEVEARLEEAIGARFNTTPEPLAHAIIKEADERMLWAEAKILLPALGEMMPEPGEVARSYIRCMSPWSAEGEFLRAFRAYGGEE